MQICFSTCENKNPLTIRTSRGFGPGMLDIGLRLANPFSYQSLRAVGVQAYVIAPGVDLKQGDHQQHYGFARSQCSGRNIDLPFQDGPCG